MNERKDGCKKEVMGPLGHPPDAASITEPEISSLSVFRPPQVIPLHSSTGTAEFSLFSDGMAR